MTKFDESNPTVRRRFLHEINGRLLVHLQRLLPDCRWNEWIVNVIILHRAQAAVESVTLETSATLYHGRKYFNHEDVGDGNVASLDGLVPLDSSYAGYCILTGSVVWVPNVRETMSDETDPLAQRYRSFGYVGVETPELPDAEYVFPIRLRTGLSEVIWGVLNCEWYRPGSEGDPFEARGRAVISHLISNSLDLHARFLPVVFDHVQEQHGDWKAIRDYYDERFSRHISRVLEESEMKIRSVHDDGRTNSRNKPSRSHERPPVPAVGSPDPDRAPSPPSKQEKVRKA